MNPSPYTRPVGSDGVSADAGHVHRERLSGLLDDASARPVTLVLAPVGAGKTTAVGDWVARGDLPGGVLWVTVEAHRGPGERWSAAAGHLADALGGYDGPRILVLDDVHHLDADDTAALLLDRLIRRMPPGLRLVLVGRRRPALPFNRLRLSGELADLRFADLAFTGGELALLLQEGRPPVPAEGAGRLLALTQGWAAIARATVDRLRAASDPSAELQSLSADDQALLGYLWEEVLPTLAPAQRQFLSRICVVERISRPLAIALTDDAGAGAVLETLRDEDLLTADPVDRDWSRTHPLIRRAFESRLRRDDPDLERALHARAARWLQDERQALPALRHAIASADWDLVGPIAVKTAIVELFGARRAELLALLDQFPAIEAAGRCELQVALACGAYCRNDGDTVWSFAAQAEAGLDRLPAERRQTAAVALAVIRASQAHRDGDAVLLASSAAAALDLIRELPPQTARGWAEYLSSPLVFRAMAELWLGRPKASLELFDAARSGNPTAARAPQHELVFYLAQIALAQALDGRIAQAGETAKRTLALAADAGLSHSHRAQEAWLALALVHLAHCDTAAAGSALDNADAATNASTTPFVTAMLAAQRATLHLGAGNLPAARTQLAGVDRMLLARPTMEAVAQLAAAVRTNVEMASNAADRAVEVLAALPVVEEEAPVVTLARASVLLATGQAAAVRSAVAAVLPERGLWGALAWVAVYEAADRLRLDAKATSALTEALDRAAPEGALLPFVGRGRRLAGALQRHLDVVGTHRDFVEQVSAAEASMGPGFLSPATTLPAMRGTLTERELSVLAYLPTMSSNDEIAAALTISPNTVKQHLKSIFHKLAVGSRREAVRLARDRGLLDAPRAAQAVRGPANRS